MTSEELNGILGIIKSALVLESLFDDKPVFTYIKESLEYEYNVSKRSVEDELKDEALSRLRVLSLPEIEALYREPETKQKKKLPKRKKKLPKRRVK